MDTDSPANEHLFIISIRLALEAASLQRMEGELELSMRTPRSLTTFLTCMAFYGQLKWRCPSNNDVVAFRGIDGEVPIYRPIPHIVEGALQKIALCA